MKNILISFVFAIVIGLLVFFLRKNDLHNTNTIISNTNIILLVTLMVVSVPLIKFIFPMTKELGIGSNEFYPNLFKKLKELIKK